MTTAVVGCELRAGRRSCANGCATLAKAVRSTKRREPGGSNLQPGQELSRHTTLTRGRAIAFCLLGARAPLQRRVSLPPQSAQECVPGHL